MSHAKRAIPFATVLTALGGMSAAQSSGPLDVTTSVSATCSSPSAGGTLILPFDVAEPLFTQPESQAEKVTITCSGGASVAYVAIGDGLHSDVGALGAGFNTRILKLEAVDGGDACFAYDLRVNSTESGAFDGVDAAATNGDGNRVTSFSESSFWIKGGIFHGAISDGGGACNTLVEDYDASAMPGGTYTDTVTLTVSLN